MYFSVCFISSRGALAHIYIYIHMHAPTHCKNASKVGGASIYICWSHEHPAVHMSVHGWHWLTGSTGTVCAMEQKCVQLWWPRRSGDWWSLETPARSVRPICCQSFRLVAEQCSCFRVWETCQTLGGSTTTNILDVHFSPREWAEWWFAHLLWRVWGLQGV